MQCLKTSLSRWSLICAMLFLAVLASGARAMAGPVDIVIVFDTTGSMQSSIDAMRTKAKETVGLARERSGDDVRVALVSYRDLYTDGVEQFVVTPFSRPSSVDGGESLERTLEVMDSWVADGGGDLAEDQLYGLELGISLWKEDDGGGRESGFKVMKTVIPITDAPFKDPDADGRTAASIAALAESVDPAHIFPIIVGSDQSAYDQAERLAALTQGTAFASADADGLVTAFLSAVDAAAENEMRHGIEATVLFEVNGTDISPAFVSTLREVAELASQHLDARLVVEGHTDSLGTNEANLKLSKQRATTVSEWLSQAGGVAPERIETRWLGESNPVAPNASPDGRDNPEGRKKNRRVEILLKK